MTEATGSQSQQFDHSIPHQTPKTGIDAQNGSMIGEGGSKKVTLFSGSKGGNGSSIMNSVERMALHSTEVAENPIATGGEAFTSHVNSGKISHLISPNLTGKVSDDTSDETNEVMKKQLPHVAHGHDDRIELSSSEKGEPIISNQEELGVQESPEELDSLEEDDALSAWDEVAEPSEEDMTEKGVVEKNITDSSREVAELVETGHKTEKKVDMLVPHSAISTEENLEEKLKEVKEDFKIFGDIRIEKSPDKLVQIERCKVYVKDKNNLDEIKDFSNFSQRSYANIFILDTISNRVFCNSAVLNDKSAIKTIQSICNENGIDPSKLQIVIVNDESFADLVVNIRNIKIAQSNTAEDADKDSDKDKKADKGKIKQRNIEAETKKEHIKSRAYEKTDKSGVQQGKIGKEVVEEFTENARKKEQEIEESEEKKQEIYDEKMDKILRLKVVKDDIERQERNKEEE